MKKKPYILLIIALVLISGCSERGEYKFYPLDFGNSSSSQSSSSAARSSNSTQQSSSSVTQSSNSTQQSSSSDTQSSSSTPQSSSSVTQSSSSTPQSSSSDTQSGSSIKNPSEIFSGTISNGGTLNVFKGEVMELDGTVKCENGGEIRIEKGGVLRLKGEIELSGDLYVQGRLIIEEGARISGSGMIHVLNSFNDIDCEGMVTAKINAPEPITKKGVTTVGGILIVNKKYSLPKDYGSGLNDELSAAVEEMRRDSGYSMNICSGFRSYAEQKWWYDYFCSIDGERTASTYSAVPGHSEHQAGLAADITSSDSSYADTDEGRWLAENCYKYGLIIRYPENKTDITGYIYEPWHVRYVGKSTAKLIYDSGLCLEEFLGIEG